jgi:hypothetical protein
MVRYSAWASSIKGYAGYQLSTTIPFEKHMIIAIGFVNHLIIIISPYK